MQARCSVTRIEMKSVPSVECSVQLVSNFLFLVKRINKSARKTTGNDGSGKLACKAGGIISRWKLFFF